MANDEPVISDAAENFRRRVLLVVGGLGQGGWIEQLDIAMSLETGPDEVAEAVHVLVEEGLLWMMKELQMMSADADVALTGAGRRVVETWEVASSRQSWLRAGCRAAVLAWLDDVAGRHPSSAMGVLARPEGHYYGRPFTQAEIRTASDDLYDRHLIDANAGHGAGHTLRPVITGRGSDVVAVAGDDLTRLARLISKGEIMEGTNSTHITLTNSPGANVAAQSSGVTQTSRVEITLTDHLDRVIGDLQELRDRLGADERVQTDEVIGEMIRVRDTEQLDRNRLRQILDDARQIWIGSMGMVGGAGALEVIQKTVELVDRLPPL